jgi:Mn2+/Fe2+ NRAMP family transporter
MLRFPARNPPLLTGPLHAMTHHPSPITSDRRLPDQIIDPPHSLGAIIRQIGPGLIIAANIVGSGELIMTTKTGAQAGISLLWLILLGCVVKVFVQLEFGRFAISHGETTLTSLNRVPGPKILGINWIVAFWAIMVATSTGQLGGILGGVSQSVSITFPITGDYQTAVQIPAQNDIEDHAAWKNGEVPASEREAKRLRRIEEELAELGDRGRILLDLSMAGKDLVDARGNSLVDPWTVDDKIWAVIIGLVTATVLFIGRYKLIELFSVALVVAFTFITLGNVAALQRTSYAISGQEFLHGLSFHFPDTGDWKQALVTAFATFGIIGVGANELISYPYWCLEKGYARSTGPRTADDSWLRRAQGWFHVMKWDAFTSMVIYTLATAAFYLMGVAVLHSEGRNPEGMRMVSTLARSYVPIFGEYAKWLFLSGAVAVLYSTFLVANAGNARMVADFAGVVGWSSNDADSRNRSRLIRGISTLLPILCIVLFLLFPKPTMLITIAGMTQSLMLPMLAFAAMYFRFYETDVRLRPGWKWDVALFVSTLALFVASSWGIYSTFWDFVGQIRKSLLT